MPAPKVSQENLASYDEIRSEGLKHESNDCSVIALTKVCGVEYAVAHKILADLGRRERKGVRTRDILTAANNLGFLCKEVLAHEFIDRYPVAHQVLRSVTTHHPKRFNKIWADGASYLLFSRHHVCAVINGVNHDWARKRCLRVTQIFRVRKSDILNPVAL